MTKLPPWLSAGQTIAWIAFGKATPAAEWADLPELQETRPWRAPRDLLLLALQARAAGENWRLPARHDGYWSKEEVDQQVDRPMRQTGLSAAALAEELQADIARVGDGVARIGDAEARLAAAKADLRGKLMTRGITAYGRRVGAAEHDAIRAEAFLCRKRKITEEGTITVPDGIDEEDTDEEDTIIVPVRTEWTDVQFRAEDVLREWPEGGDLATGAAPASPFEAGDEPIYRTGVAGRPSSVQLVEAEFRRRAEAGVVLPVLSDETQFLEGWLMEMHPTAPRMTAKTFANRLRKQHRAYAAQRPK